MFTTAQKFINKTRGVKWAFAIAPTSVTVPAAPNTSAI